MTNEIVVIYPDTAKSEPRILAAKREWVPGKVDLTPLEADLKNLIALFEKLETTGSRYEVGEAKVTVGMAKDSEGKIHLGISAKVLHLLTGEVSTEFGQAKSENQLLEITIRRKSQ